MLNIRKIERLADTGQWEALIDALAANGRPLPLSVRLRLSEAPSATVAALGLALQRMTELTYAPTAEALEAAARLCDQIHLAARAASSNRPCGSAVAVAMAGLGDLARQANDCGRGLAAPLAERIESSLRASTWLLAQSFPPHTAQAAGAASGGRVWGGGSGAGGAGGNEEGGASPIDAAVLLWQLGGRADLRTRVHEVVPVAAIERDVRRLGWWKRADCAAVLALAEAIGQPARTQTLFSRPLAA
ncbi:MAG: hypothetical protein ACKVS8_02900 [Phycisphaerales bacterium]